MMGAPFIIKGMVHQCRILMKNQNFSLKFHETLQKNKLRWMMAFSPSNAKGQKANSTRDSQAVTHPSTDRALR